MIPATFNILWIFSSLSSKEIGINCNPLTIVTLGNNLFIYALLNNPIPHIIPSKALGYLSYLSAPFAPLYI